MRPEYQKRRPPQNPNDGKGKDRYSRKVAGATADMEKQPDPTNPVSIIANYARLGESLRAAGNFRKVAMEIARIAELAETTAMEETADWFDGHTVKRNMAELKKYAGAFSKLAEELDMQQQRAAALYDDMGNVLGRYFDMAELTPITSAINPDDRAPEFDGAGGNPVDDKAREDWDARDGVDDGISPDDRAPEFDGAGGNPTDDAGRRAHDAQDGIIDDSEDDDDVVEGLVNRIMEKLSLESKADNKYVFVWNGPKGSHINFKAADGRSGAEPVHGNPKAALARIKKVFGPGYDFEVQTDESDLYDAPHLSKWGSRYDVPKGQTAPTERPKDLDKGPKKVKKESDLYDKSSSKKPSKAFLKRRDAESQASAAHNKARVRDYEKKLGYSKESAGAESPEQAKKALRTPAAYSKSHQGFSHDQAKEILRRTGATNVEEAGRAMESASGKKREATIRKIVAQHQYAKIDGQMVDATTANAMVAVLDALNPEQKATYLALPITQMANVTWKLIRKK